MVCWRIVVFALCLDIVLWKLPMEWSFANEHMISGNNETIEIYMNDVDLEDGSEENPKDQIETNRNPRNWSEEIMKGNLKTLHAQREF